MAGRANAAGGLPCLRTGPLCQSPSFKRPAHGTTTNLSTGPLHQCARWSASQCAHQPPVCARRPPVPVPALLHPPCMHAQRPAVPPSCQSPRTSSMSRCVLMGTWRLSAAMAAAVTAAACAALVAPAASPAVVPLVTVLPTPAANAAPAAAVLPTAGPPPLLLPLLPLRPSLRPLWLSLLLMRQLPLPLPLSLLQPLLLLPRGPSAGCQQR